MYKVTPYTVVPYESIWGYFLWTTQYSHSFKTESINRIKHNVFACSLEQMFHLPFLFTLANEFQSAR